MGLSHKQNGTSTKMPQEWLLDHDNLLHYMQLQCHAVSLRRWKMHFWSNWEFSWSCYAHIKCSPESDHSDSTSGDSHVRQ